jgi:hypothetical protein
MKPAPTVSSAAEEEPPPSYERRFLIRVSDHMLTPSLAQACRRWQQAYIGAVFVSVDAERTESGAAALVDSLLAAGCSETLTTFYMRDQVQHLPELAALVGELWLHTAHDPPAPLSAQRALEVAEVLALGATDSIGVPETVVRAARATAAAVNRRLTSSELPLPALKHPHSLHTAPANGVVPSPSRRALDAPGHPSQAADRLLSEGARAVALDCEQLIDLLFEAAEPQS